LGVQGQLFASQLVLEVTRSLAQILLGAAVAAADCQIRDVPLGHIPVTEGI